MRLRATSRSSRPSRAPCAPTTRPDITGARGSPWRWNEWELFSREAAEGDATLLAAIDRFWTRHVPILSSVRSGYAYLALDLEREGAVVYGHEPAFEAASDVCGSFDELLDLLARAGAERPMSLQLL